VFFGLIMRVVVGYFREVSKDKNFGFCAKGGDFYNSPRIEFHASKLIILF